MGVAVSPVEGHKTADVADLVGEDVGGVRLSRIGLGIQDHVTEQRLKLLTWGYRRATGQSVKGQGQTGGLVSTCPEPVRQQAYHRCGFWFAGVWRRAPICAAFFVPACQDLSEPLDC